MSEVIILNYDDSNEKTGLSWISLADVLPHQWVLSDHHKEMCNSKRLMKQRLN